MDSGNSDPQWSQLRHAVAISSQQVRYQ